MNILKKIMLSLGLAVAGEAPLAGAAVQEPDFAHPRKVIAGAYTVLRSSGSDSAAGPQRVEGTA